MVFFRHAFIFLSIWLMNKPVVLLAQQRNSNWEIQEVWRDFIFAWENLDASACSDFYMEDGLNIPPELPENKGRTAIEHFYKGLFEAHQSSKYHHQTQYIERDGDLLIEYGAFHVEWVTLNGDMWEYKARVLVHWVKDDSDSWKIKTLIFNQAP